MTKAQRTLKELNEWLHYGIYKGMKGWFGFKVFESKDRSYVHQIPKSWNISEGTLLKSIVNKNTNTECGCGVNFASANWHSPFKRRMFKGYVNYTCYEYMRIFVVFAEASNIRNIIVPRKHCGKFRTNRLWLCWQLTPQQINTIWGG